MCGIVGLVGDREAAPILLDALRRLEYRGYDSAGIATLNAGRIDRRRAAGKLIHLEKELAADPLSGTIGIGHTRWATHGAPTLTNAHPHVGQCVALVHNGIIENFADLKKGLISSGTVFTSQTDTEVVAHLLASEFRSGAEIEAAIPRLLTQLRGAYALAMLVEGEEDMLIAARHGPPLAIGVGDQEMYVGSDAIALAPLSQQLIYLEDGDWAVIRRGGAEIYDTNGARIDRPSHHISGPSLVFDKGNHRHFMAKEIFEQPEVVAHTLSYYFDLGAGEIRPARIDECRFDEIDRLIITACGTAFFAGMAGKYWFERLAGLPVEIDIASEFRYRHPPMSDRVAAMVVSQSGETADSLAALRYCLAARKPTMAIVNVPQSSIAREAEQVFPTFAGPEIGVASTKAYSCQLAVLLSLALIAGYQRGRLSKAELSALIAELAHVPRQMSDALHLDKHIAELAPALSRARQVLYLGRGLYYPLALEGALKFKEISYLHAEGYAGGELKHGPIALVEENLPVVVIAPHDDLFEKTLSNMEEVRSRGADIILLTDSQGASLAQSSTASCLAMPDADPLFAIFVQTIPVQLLAYHTAAHLGTDVDQPRNLAKSVTVE